MTISMNNRQKGFSLIEVLVALVITVVGMLAIINLQTEIMETGGIANQRVIAGTMSEKKLDEFRDLAATGDFDTIVDGTDALETVGNAQFSVNWDVTDYYFPGLLQPATTPVPVGQSTDFKQIEFTVSWAGISGPESLTMSSVVDGSSSLFTGIDDGTGVGGIPPNIFYNPLDQPDVVPVAVGDDGALKETSTPIPDVTKSGGGIITTFEVVTYIATSGGRFITQRREEFTTLSCGCTSTGLSSTITEGAFEWNEDAEILADVFDTSKSGVVGIAKDLGSGNDSQPFECDICCANKITAVASGNDYVQSCRLKRIDGINTVMPDWKLVAMDLVPDNFFDEDAVGMTSTLAAGNITAYSDYVIGLVRARLGNAQNVDTTPGADPKVTAVFPSTFYQTTGVTTTFKSFTGVANYVDGGLDHKVYSVTTIPIPFSARAVYMDIPPREIYESIYTATNVPFERIPFYNVNLTQQVAWIPDGDSNNTYSNNDNDAGDTDFTRSGAATLPDYAQAFVSEDAPSSHTPAPFTGIHDRVKVTGGAGVTSECHNARTRNCIMNEEIKNKNDEFYTRGDFFANDNNSGVGKSEFVQFRIKKSNTGITDTVQNGEQNVVEMPTSYSGQTVDVGIEVTVN